MKDNIRDLYLPEQQVPKKTKQDTEYRISGGIRGYYSER